MTNLGAHGLQDLLGGVHDLGADAVTRDQGDRHPAWVTGDTGVTW